MKAAEALIFLCHAKEDEEAVVDIYQRLKIEGFHPWIYSEDILPGQDWVRETRKALRSASLILIFLSTSSVSKRGYVQREIKLALKVAEEFPENKIAIIPVRLDDCEIPDSLSHLYYCDLFTEDGFEKLMKSINVSLKRSKVRDDTRKLIPKLPNKKKPSPLKRAEQPATDVERIQHAEVQSGDSYQAYRDIIIHPPGESVKPESIRNKVMAWLTIITAILAIITFAFNIPQKIEEALSPRSARFYGKVIYENGKGVGGAQIEVFEKEGEEARIGKEKTKPNGEFDFLVKAKPEESVWVVVTLEGQTVFQGLCLLLGNQKIIFRAR